MDAPPPRSGLPASVIGAGRGWTRHDLLLVLVGSAAPAVPVLIALAARRQPPWVPDLDLALTELRVRDVGGPDSPLIGLPGRFGTFERQGSHPGPIAFYLLAPIYRLGGATAFALQASTVALHLAGAWAAVALAARRLGARGGLWMGGALALLVAAIGPNLFTEPWNPHLPLLWWPAFLVASWCALSGDVTALPVVVLGGALAAQTHISYLGLVAVITVAAVGVAARWPDERWAARPGRWVVGALVLGVVLWSPPVLDQLLRSPGNAVVVTDHLRSAAEPAVGAASGARLVLEHLDLWHLARAVIGDPGLLGESYPRGASAGRGAVLLLAWVVAAVPVVRRSSRPVAALHVLAGVNLVLAVASASQILGRPWSYLLLWLWTVLLLVVSSVVAAVTNRSRRATPRWLGPAVALVVVAVSVRASSAGLDSEPASPVLSRTVQGLVPTVLDELDPGARYLVRWNDAVNLGGHGYGMFDELERQGVDVVVPDGLATQFGRHRAVRDAPVDGVIVVATGAAIAQWQEVPRAREIARLDARTPAERAEATRVRRRLVRVLQRGDLDDLVPVIDENLYGVAFDPRLDAEAQDLVARLGALGAPAAVFLTPAGTEPLPRRGGLVHPPELSSRRAIE